MLVISFVALAALWPKPRMEGRPPWRPLPGGAVLGSAPVEILCGAIGVALLVVVVLAGYLGCGHGARQLRADVHPDHVLGRARVRSARSSATSSAPSARGGRSAALLPSKGLRPYPEKLGRWPAAVGLLVFTWIELASGWGEDPALLVTAALGYTVLTLIAQVVCGVETWTRYGETFAVYYNLFSRISPFETRDRVVGVRPPLSGLPQLDPRARHGRAGLGDDRHGHLRRAHARAGCGRTSRSTSPTSSPSVGIPITDAPKFVVDDRAPRSASRSSRSSTARASRARAPSAATSAPSGCGARSCTRSCRSRWSTSPRTT